MSKSKVKVRAIEVPPGMLVDWWRDLFNFQPKTKEEEKQASTLLERIKKARGFYFDDEKETISVEAGTCPKCKKDWYHREAEGEARKILDAGGCPGCKGQLDVIGKLIVVIEGDLRSALWDHRKEPLKKPCALRIRESLRKEAAALGYSKDWKALAGKSEPEPLPDPDDLEFETGPLEEEEPAKEVEGTEAGKEPEKFEPKLVEDEKPEPEPAAK